MQCGKSIVEYTLYIQEPYTYVYMKDLIKEDQISLIERSNGRKQRENIPKRINNEKGKYKTRREGILNYYVTNCSSSKRSALYRKSEVYFFRTPCSGASEAR